MKKLEKKHALHIAGYGEGNERRLTGKHETSSMESFRCSPLMHEPVTRACCMQCSIACLEPEHRASAA